jgi:hypothetical protein
VIRPGEWTIEYFDDLHAAAAAWTRRRLMVGTAWAIVIIVMAIRRGRGHIEQASTERELVGAMGVSEEAVVANAMEAVRQHVEQEAPHELADVEAHD